jgi:hypothetical protein
MLKRCKFCDLSLEDYSVSARANHTRWCDKNPNRKKTTENIGAARKRGHAKKWGELKDFQVKCLKCDCEFTVNEREKRFPEREKYFCSRSCANSRGPRSESFKEKVRKKLTGRKTEKRKTGIVKNCNFCEEDYVARNNKRKFCSKKCAASKRKKDTSTLASYRRAASFRFALSDYPDCFNFDLIREHGWYSPATSKKPNLTGVSRDHMVSVKWGFENNIDPKIIAHPANCRLMIHGENVSKGTSCDMTIEELKDRIANWESK